MLGMRPAPSWTHSTMSGFNSVHRLTPLKVSILTTQHPQTPTVRVSQDAPTLAQGPGESHRTPEGVVPSASCRLGPAGGSGEQGLCQPRDPAAGRADPAAGLKGGHAGPEGHPGNSRHRDTTPTQPEQRAGSEQEEPSRSCTRPQTAGDTAEFSP